MAVSLKARNEKLAKLPIALGYLSNRSVSPGEDVKAKLLPFEVQNFLRDDKGVAFSLTDRLFLAIENRNDPGPGTITQTTETESSRKAIANIKGKIANNQEKLNKARRELETLKAKQFISQSEKTRIFELQENILATESAIAFQKDEINAIIADDTPPGGKNEVLLGNLLKEKKSLENKIIAKEKELDATKLAFKKGLLQGQIAILKAKLSTIQPKINSSRDDDQIFIKAPSKQWKVEIYYKTNTKAKNVKKQYTKFDAKFYMPTFSRTSVILKVRDETVSEIKNFFKNKNLTPPKYGLLRLMYYTRRDDIVSARENEFSYESIWLKTTLEPSIKREVTGQTVTINKAVYTDVPTAYENLFVPKLSTEFIYNFYLPTEESEKIAKQTNFAGKKLSEVPRYIKLNWTPSPSIYINNLDVEKEREDLENQIKEFTKAISKILNIFDDARRDKKGFLTDDRREELDKSLKTLQETLKEKYEELKVFNEKFPKNLKSKTVPIISNISNNLGSNKFLLDGTMYTIDQKEEESNVLLGNTDTARIYANSVIKGNKVDIVTNSEKDFVNNQIKKNNFPDALTNADESSRYIGYIILKEKKNEEFEQYEFEELIPIFDPKRTEYIDTKVVYGASYRYKIRSVFKFINNDNLSIFRDVETSLDPNRDDLIKFQGKRKARKVFYFDSRFSNDSEIDCVDLVRPDPPYNLMLVPNSKKKTMFITWNQKQQNRDVIGYNIYKRINDGPMKKINVNLIPRRDNFYIDKNLEFENEYTYAIESVDYHDNFSLLSFQYSNKLTPQDFSFVREESEQDLEVPKNLELDDIYQPPEFEKDIVFFNKKLIITVNPLFKNLERDVTYLLKIKSLDTFEEKDIKLQFKINTITHTSDVDLKAKDPSKKTSKELVEDFNKSLDRDDRVKTIINKK